MVNKKLSMILGPVLGIMGFMLTIGVIEVPVLAVDNVQANSVNSDDLAFKGEKDYFVSINKSATQNGIKITVDKAIATKHKIKVILKVESEKPLEKMKHGNSIFEVTYGENNNKFTQSSKEYIDDKTMTVTLEKDNDKDEYPMKGEMRVDVVFSNYKVNIGIDAYVDFTKSFKNIVEKDISGKIPEFDYTLKEIESDVMGTRITYSEPKGNDDEADKSDNLFNSIMILKVGDKMYKVESNGSYSGKNKEKLGNYETSSVTYDKIKDEKNISIIPVTCNITWEELDKMYEEETKEGNTNKERNSNKETSNNVSYEKTFNFNDGTEGEIYNIERNDNSIKIYCKGVSEKESILMASNMEIHYQHAKDDSDKTFYDNKNVCFYKDPKESLGYIVEFNNVEKDKAVELYSFDSLIKHVDRYKLEDEIQISK